MASSSSRWASPALVPAAEAAPVVVLKDGIAYANSRDVAAFFGKEHKNVLRDIDVLIATAPPSIGLSFELNMRPTKVGFGVRFDRTYDMTKDGFVVLAMGFNGAKALEFKARYIETFNALVEENRQLKATAPALPNFADPAATARAWADEYEGRKAAERKLIEVQPQLAVAARVEQHERRLCTA
jgi:Rha family phage regulatory protein